MQIKTTKIAEGKQKAKGHSRRQAEGKGASMRAPSAPFLEAMHAAAARTSHKASASSRSSEATVRKYCVKVA